MEPVAQPTLPARTNQSFLAWQIPGLRAFPTRFGILLLMFGHIVIVSAIVTDSMLLQTPYSPIFFATLMGQLGLLGLWVSLGSGAFGMRVVATALCAYVLALAIEFVVREGMSAAWFMAVIGIANVAVPALLLRWLKGVFIGEPGANDVRSNGIQFGIRDLMVLTMLVGFLLAFSQWVAPKLPNPDYWSLAIAFGSVSAAIALLACWATLSKKSIIGRIALFIVLVIICGDVETRIMGRPGGRGSWYVYTATQGAVVLASLLVVRWSGFRLTKSARA